MSHSSTLLKSPEEIIVLHADFRLRDALKRLLQGPISSHSNLITTPSFLPVFTMSLSVFYSSFLSLTAVLEQNCPASELLSPLSEDRACLKESQFKSLTSFTNHMIYLFSLMFLSIS